MENPTKEANYTTIFADGSIIYENPWLVFPDGHGKWYWDEETRGGVIAWNEIPKGGYKFHKFYKLPDWELQDLLYAAYHFYALQKGGVDNWEWYGVSIDDFCKAEHINSIDELVEQDLIEGYFAGYQISDY